LRERAKARQQARQAAKEELRAIVKAWNDAFAFEVFFAELSRRAATLDGEARENVEARIRGAREPKCDRLLPAVDRRTERVGVASLARVSPV
jgi:hypothetical protein